MSDHVVVGIQDRILTIGLNRPEKKNALTSAMYSAMTEALAKADGDPSTRVVLITGTPDCFTAGNDLADFAAAKPGQVSPAVRYLETLAAMAKPVVAAVGGVAIGIGTTMLSHCDLVYAAQSARFHLPFVNLGLCPEAASSAILPALMGTHRAAGLVLLGEPFGAEAARDLGLVNQVVADADLLATATTNATTTRAKASCGSAGHEDASQGRPSRRHQASYGPRRSAIRRITARSGSERGDGCIYGATQGGLFPVLKHSTK